MDEESMAHFYIKIFVMSWTTYFMIVLAKISCVILLCYYYVAKEYKYSIYYLHPFNWIICVYS